MMLRLRTRFSTAVRSEADETIQVFDGYLSMCHDPSEGITTSRV
jgi:hypothetical protein